MRTAVDLSVPILIVKSKILKKIIFFTIRFALSFYFASDSCFVLFFFTIITLFLFLLFARAVIHFVFCFFSCIFFDTLDRRVGMHKPNLQYQ